MIVIMAILETADEYRITRFVKGKDFVSLLNCLFGLYSIYFAIIGNFKYSAILMILAVVADILDGQIARMLSQSNDFGKRMDMADLVSFGAAPAIFILIRYQGSLLLHLAAISLLSAALFRLARFQNKSSTISGFVGVPTTTNGIIFPLLYFLEPYFLLPKQYTVIATTFLMSILMLSSIIIPIKQ